MLRVIFAITRGRLKLLTFIKTGFKEQIIESRAQLDIILKGITDGIMVLDENRKFVYANKMGAKICGFSSVEDFLKTPEENIMQQIDIRDEEGRIFSLMELPSKQALDGVVDPPEVIVRFRLKNTHEERWLIVKSSPVFDEARKVRLAVSIFKDFTDRKRSEDALKYLDEVSRVLSSSLDYEKTLGLIAKLAVPKIADWCVIDIIESGKTNLRTVAVQHCDETKLKYVEEIAQKYKPNWSDALGLSKVLQSGESVFYNEISNELLQNLCREDKKKLQLISAIGLNSVILVPLSSRGFTYGAISLFASESGRKYTEIDLKFVEELARRCGTAIDNALLFAEVQEQRNQYRLAHFKMEKLASSAAAANQVKSLFLANMSHEIRTPLGAILGFVDLLNDTDLSPQDRKKYSDVIIRNGHQLTQLIDDILDLSKVEAGHLDIEILEMSLQTLLSDISALMTMRAQEKGLSFTMCRGSELPEFIYSDPTRLRQILVNIIGNAIKFTSRGEVKVKISADPVGENNMQKIVFTVDDTGFGISSTKQSRLFEWFTQADASTTRKFGGTGLGLALSRKLARALGGDVSLSRSSSAGSQFSIVIANNLSAKSTENTQLVERETKSETIRRSLNGVRVLLVEDSADNRMLIGSILSRSGIKIESADNGREGIAMALNGQYDLVLMDIQMPICDGLQATTELRKKGYGKPIVALTAHAMKEEREKTFAVGCNTHLTKPIEFKKLLQVIEEFTRI